MPVGHTVVVGASRVGLRTIADLAADDRECVLIDQDPAACAAHHDQYGSSTAITGEATDDEVLRAAGVPTATALVSCLANDRDNIVVALSSRLINPGLRIVSRCSDIRVAPKMKAAGVDTVVSPNVIGGRRLAAALLQPITVEFAEALLGGGVDGVRLEELGVSTTAGLTLGNLRERAPEVVVIATRHADGEWHYSPADDELLGPGVHVAFVGPAEARLRVERLLVP